MDVDQALRALTQLKSAAPPTTASRISDVITLVRQLDTEASSIQEQAEETVRALNAQVQRLEEDNDTLGEQVTRVQQQMSALTAQIAALQTEIAARARNQDDLLPKGFATLQPTLQNIREQALSLRSGRLGRMTTEQADCLQLIDDYAAAARSLVATLDDIVQIRQDALAAEPLIFSGLDLLAEAWQRLYNEAEQHEHQISIHADDPLPAVVGDYQHILSVLVDLLDNAIRYTPVGGTIRITAETLGVQVLFSIADNGIGLTPDDLTHISSPFWRALHQPLVRQQQGAGLRLFRARSILELNESELFFSGEPGMGSTFSFTLPTG